MNFLGLQIDRNGIRRGARVSETTATAKAAGTLINSAGQSVSGALVTSVPAAAVSTGGRGGWWGIVRESFAGAWQRNVEIDATEGLLAFSAIYACLDLISKDISSLRLRLVEFQQGVWVETANSAFSPVLRKPNGYQTRIQFLSSWVLSKLIHGNTYVIKERDARGVVVALHVLNPRMVKVMVAEDGGVYYQVSQDKLAQVKSMLVPASEVIHDRAACLFHPLVGVPPIYACAMSASQGNRIQNNSAKFFENMSRPSGMLTAPDTIDDETAGRLKADFETNFSGANLGRLLVTGDGLKYEPMTIPAQQAQLIEQLAWTVQDVARCFHVPQHKLASDSGVKYANMAEMNQDYYTQCLRDLIENIEVLLDEGLGLATGGPQLIGVDLDLEGLLRMDPLQRAERTERLMKAAVMSPDEGRATEGMLPLPDGAGKEPFMQQQNYPLSVLVKQPPPGATPAAPKPAEPAPSADPPAPDPVKSIEATLAALDRLTGDVRVMREEQETLQKAEERAAQAARRDAERLAQAEQIAVELRAENEELARQKAAAEEQMRVAEAVRAEQEAAAATAAEAKAIQETTDFALELIRRFERTEA